MMKQLDSKEELQMLKNLIFVSLISADNEEYTEEVKQQILSRYHEVGFSDWSYVLDPLGEDKYKYMKILMATAETDEEQKKS